jgi:transposase
LIAPDVDTRTFNQLLKILTEELMPGDHAVLITVRAGWHKSNALMLPDNITILLLPSYSPELNPIENL